MPVAAPKPSERFAEYIALCRTFHETHKTFSGRGCLKHAGKILELADQVGARSALDFGCGKAVQFSDTVPGHPDGTTLESILGFEVTKYDPAVPRFSEEPTGKFDLVWATDVLEHVPEEDIDYVVHRLGALTRKALFVTVGSGPAKKTLPNGENAHVTQKPADWWEARFAPIRRCRGANAIALTLVIE